MFIRLDRDQLVKIVIPCIESRMSRLYDAVVAYEVDGVTSLSQAQFNTYMKYRSELVELDEVIKALRARL